MKAYILTKLWPGSIWRKIANFLQAGVFITHSKSTAGVATRILADHVIQQTHQQYDYAWT